MKTLVLTAHPDDLELSCGGTIKKIVDQGGSVDNLIIFHIKIIKNIYQRLLRY